MAGTCSTRRTGRDSTPEPAPVLLALNGGPGYPFTEAISLSVDCEDQAEVDRYPMKKIDVAALESAAAS